MRSNAHVREPRSRATGEQTRSPRMVKGPERHTGSSALSPHSLKSVDNRRKPSQTDQAVPQETSPSSLPAWISTLEEADQPEPTVTGRTRSDVPGAHDDMSWELQTERAGDEASQHDADLEGLRAAHARQLAHYKNLLIRAQSAASTALHELHTKLHSLQSRYDALLAEHAECASRRAEQEEDRSLMKAIGTASLEDKVRAMGRAERLGLLSRLTEACNPSDVTAQMALLEKYRRSRFDIMGRLDSPLTVRILGHLEVQDIMNLRAVSKTHAKLTRTPSIWRDQCFKLDYLWTEFRESGPDYFAEPIEWETGYRDLLRREQNWRTGSAQRVMSLEGHTDSVTTMKLKDGVLVTGSSDGTVRVWKIRKGLFDGSSTTSIALRDPGVSCLDYYPAKGIIATGHHNAGHIQLWKCTARDAWMADRILTGHSHGVRMLTLNYRCLVSAGSDKAIVIWDTETGEKIARFGQQPNLCIGLHLVHDKVVSVTIDGLIRTFDIGQRAMIGQHKLSQLCRQSGYHCEGELQWAEGNGCILTCGTRSGIVQLAWQVIVGSGEPPVTPLKSGPSTPLDRSRRASLMPASPASPSPPGPPSTRTPARRVTSLAAPASSTPPRRQSTQRTLALRSVSVSTAGSSTLVSPSPTRGDTPLDKRALTAPSSLSQKQLVSDGTIALPLLSMVPAIVRFVTTSGIVHGCIDNAVGRIVLCQRDGARLTTSKRAVLVLAMAVQSSSMVPLGGAWDVEGHGSIPAIIAVDRDRIVYGCSDGTIVSVEFSMPIASG